MIHDAATLVMRDNALKKRGSVRNAALVALNFAMTLVVVRRHQEAPVSTALSRTNVCPENGNVPMMNGLKGMNVGGKIISTHLVVCSVLML